LGCSVRVRALVLLERGACLGHALLDSAGKNPALPMAVCAISCY